MVIQMDSNTKFEVIDILGNKALFTSQRIHSKDVPIGLFRYELRHADDDGMIPCEVSLSIMVNHYGTILTNKPIQMLHNGCTLFDGDKDIKFLNEYISVDSYKKKYRQQTVKKKKDLSR